MTFPVIRERIRAIPTRCVASFFTDITQSSYFDLLAEYSTA
jgi:hypothetical protein